MAVTQSPFCNPMPWGLARDTDATTLAESNIRGGPTTLLAIQIVSPAGDDAHVKLYDATSVTAGTTDPDWIIPIRAGTTRPVIFNTAGAEFDNGLTERCVTGAGTAGTTDPSQDITIDFIAIDET